jgi:hypothetical protein
MARKRERMRREKAISNSCTFDTVLYAFITLSEYSKFIEVIHAHGRRYCQYFKTEFFLGSRCVFPAFNK